jgi:plastocyanin
MFCLRCSAALTLMAASVLAGCKSERPASGAGSLPATATESANAAPATVTVTATDYAFDAPATAPAGAVTIHLINHGKELHQVQLIKLENGKTAADLGKALHTPGPPPAWIKFVGGPNGIAPGQEARATSVLAPGSYAYLCFIPSQDGVMHTAKGMVRPFEVTAASGALTEAPTADVTITLTDYAFESSRPLTAGRHTIMVKNAGPQPHEIVLLKLAPGKKTEDFGKWAETGMKGPPPAEPLGGVGFLDKGLQGSFTADLTPGEYGFICFVPDAKDGKPHLAHGMMKTVTVD